MKLLTISEQRITDIARECGFDITGRLLKFAAKVEQEVMYPVDLVLDEKHSDLLAKSQEESIDECLSFWKM